jgi:uncharacterized protein
MSGALVRRVDPFKSLGGKISGELPESVLKRWLEISDRAPGSPNRPVQVDLLIDREERYVVISGSIQTQVDLVCQRCLATVNYMLNADVRWSPVANDTEARALPDDLDPAELIDGMLDLYWQIEEQLLLELPNVPKHSTAHECEQNDIIRALRIKQA